MIGPIAEVHIPWKARILPRGPESYRFSLIEAVNTLADSSLKPEDVIAAMESRRRFVASLSERLSQAATLEKQKGAK